MAAVPSQNSGFLFDVFLSHNSQDKPIVRALAAWLTDNNVRCFLDENDLEPGDVLSDKLGRAMENSRSAIICVGPNGEGPWHREEIDTLLNRSIKLSRQKNEFRIIPVILPNADTSKLRWFLETRLWCNLSTGISDSGGELQRLRRAILGESPAQATCPDQRLNPYQGLEAFDKSTARFFFGRNKECAQLATLLRDWRFACIMGASGNGKSSLARAGLHTSAADEVLPGIKDWETLVFSPGGNLLRSLLDALYRPVPNVDRANASAQAYSRILPNPDQATAQTWAEGLDFELRSFYGGQEQPVLILIDQFEEIFTHPSFQTMTEKHRSHQIQLVLAGLAALVDCGSRRWNLVVTVRSDFKHQFRTCPSFWNLLFRRQGEQDEPHLLLELDELDEEGWRSAIKAPAERVGAYLEVGLAELLLKDVYRQRGSMPLLQLALQELWIRQKGSCLTHAAYMAVGGVENALQRRADRAFSLLQVADEEYFEIARNLFLRLTSPGEGVSDSRRRLDRSELEWNNTDPDKIEHVVSTLSNANNRLLVTDAQSLEVTHEILIRECTTVRAWIEPARRDIPVLRRLTHAARRWQDHNFAPTYLNAADPPHELKSWIRRSTCRLTTLELRYWKASRLELIQLHREKRERANQTITASKRIYRAAAIASLFAIIATICLVLSLFAYRAKGLQRDIAVQKTAEAHLQVADAYWQVAALAAGRHQPSKAANCFLRAATALELAGAPQSARNAELAAQCSTEGLMRSFVHDSRIAGGRFVRADTRILTWDRLGVIELWNEREAFPIHTWKHGDGVNGVSVARDESRFVSYSIDGSVCLWDMSLPKAIAAWKQDHAVVGTMPTRDGSRILCWGGDGGFDGRVLKPGEVVLWHVASATPIRKWRRKGRVGGALLSTDECRVLAWSDDGTIMLYDVSKLQPIQQWEAKEAFVGAVFSRDESKILAWTGDRDFRDHGSGDVMLLDPRVKRPIQVWHHDASVAGALFTKDECRVLAWTGNQTQNGAVTLWHVSKKEPIFYERHGRQVNGARFSSDELRVLAWSGDLNQAGQVTLSDLATGKQLNNWPQGGWVKGATFTRDESRILAWSLNGTVAIWEVGKGEPIRIWQQNGRVNGARFVEDESKILAWHGHVGGKAGAVTMLDVGRSEPVQVWSFNGEVFAAQFERAGSRVLAMCRDGPARLLDTRKIGPANQSRHSGEIQGAKLTRDESRLLLTTWQNWPSRSELTLLDAKSLAYLREWKHDNSECRGIFTRDETRVITWAGHAMSGNSGMITFADVGRPEPIQVWTRKLGISDLVFNRAESRVLAWGEHFCDRGEVTLWSIDSREPLRIWPHLRGINGAVFSRDESRVLSWSGNDVSNTPEQGPPGEIKLWDVTKSDPLGIWKNDANVRHAMFTRDETQFLTWNEDGAMKLWDVDKTDPIEVWNSVPWKVAVGILKRTGAKPSLFWRYYCRHNAVLTKDEGLVLTWSEHGLSLWNVEREEMRRSWKDDSGIVRAVFGGDENRIISWSSDGTIRLWSVCDSEALRVWQHVGRVNGVLFDRTNTRLLSWGEDGRVKLWDVTRGEPIHVWSHDRSVNGAQFVRDESRVMSWGDDGRLKIWNAALRNGAQPPSERILELEIRSAMKLDLSGQMRTLTAKEWGESMREWERINGQAYRESFDGGMSNDG